MDNEEFALFIQVLAADAHRKLTTEQAMEIVKQVKTSK